MSQIIYILTNQFMPDLVKIGKTNSTLEERMRNLSSHTGVPVPFECYYACEVEDSDKVEKGLHDGFLEQRVNPRREFFKISPERVRAILKLVELRDITPMVDVVENAAEQEVLNKARSRQPNFQFKMVDIEIGSELKFARDESITCKVVSDKKVEFEGEEFFLSKLTLEILKNQFDEELRAVRGPDFWLYEDESLTSRRFQMETSDG